jgi:hypothetical protein
MSDLKIHKKISKTVITMLVLIFSLSPCSVKRDLLCIFDIEYISSFNKVKLTASQTFSCDSSAETSSGRIVLSKVNSRSGKDFPFKFNSISNFSKEDQSFNKSYSGATSGSSPPKYILFKQLKLNVV